jgi:hypothetical protein
LEYDLPEGRKGQEWGLRVREGKVRDGAARFNVVYTSGEDEGT